MNLKEFKEKKKQEDLKTNQSLRSHLVSYIAVNIGIFLLNIMTSHYPWFLFVAGGWGIGMASHWGERFIANKNYNESKAISVIPQEELNDLIQHQNRRHNFYLHVISNIAVSSYLLMINLITSTAFMWAFIPMIAMGIGIASHWGTYTNKKYISDSEDFISEDDLNISENTQLARAMKLRESIISIITDIRVKFKNFASDLLPKIDSYVETITLITKKVEDLEKILNEVSEKELLKEKDEIIKKREMATSSQLMEEYDNLLKELDNHILTIKKLKEQKELLELKITTSINSLKHLNLELVGMKSKATVEDTTILDEFSQKSTDLAIYYKDLLDSYDELHK